MHRRRFLKRFGEESIPAVFRIETTSSLTVFELPLTDFFATNPEFDFVVDWGDGTNDIITSVGSPEKFHDYGVAGTFDITISGNTLVGWSFVTTNDVNSNIGGTSKLLKDILQWGNVIKYIDNRASFDSCIGLTSISATDSPYLVGVVKSFFSECINLTNVNLINEWDTSNVTDMGSFFSAAEKFNNNLDQWDTSNVTNMEYMFTQASLFNGSIGSWDTSNVNSMRGMFKMQIGQGSFNQDISNWDVSSVTNMNSMFYRLGSFNQDISNWDVSSVTNMSYMFYVSTLFNQPIGNWNTINLLSTFRMFSFANNFDQNISLWNITNLSIADDMFNGIQLSTANYDALLIGWEAQNVQQNVVFDGGNSTYTSGSAAATARASLESNDGWSITDGGFV